MVEGIDKLKWAIGGSKGPFGAPWPQNPQDSGKWGGFSITFRKFWKISGRKRDLFFDFFNFPGGYPSFFWKIGQKSILGGLWGPNCERMALNWPSIGQNDPKMPILGGLGALGPPFWGPWGPYQPPPQRGVKYLIFPFKYVQKWALYGPIRYENVVILPQNPWNLASSDAKMAIFFPYNTVVFFYSWRKSHANSHMYIYI